MPVSTSADKMLLAANQRANQAEKERDLLQELIAGREWQCRACGEPVSIDDAKITEKNIIGIRGLQHKTCPDMTM